MKRGGGGENPNDKLFLVYGRICVSIIDVLLLLNYFRDTMLFNLVDSYLRQ